MKKKPRQKGCCAHHRPRRAAPRERRPQRRRPEARAVIGSG